MTATDVLSGLEELRARTERFGSAPGVGRLLGFEVVTIDHGHVAFAMTTSPDHGNPMGTLHGGIYATLLDSVMGCAVQAALPPGVGYTTLELKVNLVRAVALDGTRLVGDGRVIHVGGRTATAEGTIVDGDGRLVAHATTTCLVLRP